MESFERIFVGEVKEMIRGTNVCGFTPRRRYRDGVMKQRLRFVLRRRKGGG